MKKKKTKILTGLSKKELKRGKKLLRCYLCGREIGEKTVFMGPTLTPYLRQLHFHSHYIKTEKAKFCFLLCQECRILLLSVVKESFDYFLKFFTSAITPKPN